MIEPIFKLNFDGIAAISDEGGCLTYAELAEECRKWALDIPSRSLVFLLVKNNLQSLIAYVACIRHGVVPLMLDAKIDLELLNHFIKVYKPYKVFNCADGSGGVVNANRTSLHPDLALLLTTSGSVGSPKLVRQSYSNIRANAESIAEYLRLDQEERPITTLPMNYTYGLSIINSHLAVGATILLTEKGVVERDFWNFFTAQGATSFGGVPYTYEMLDKLSFFRRSLPSLKTMTQAGGKILPDLHRKFAEYAMREGKNFVVMYGQCEATARMAYLPPARALDKVGSMGIPIPGGRMLLVDANGQKIDSSDEMGELIYEGPNVTLGYAECADDLSKGDEWHGRLITGDMAQRDSDGFYYIVGRKKRFLKIFGNRVNLDETERLIKSRFPELDCACGGVDDKMRIYVTDSSAVPNVRRFIAEKTHINFMAFEVLPIAAIPKNSSGKTLYSKLS